MHRLFMGSTTPRSEFVFSRSDIILGMRLGCELFGTLLFNDWWLFFSGE